jgi:hypothetical protein
MTSRSNRPEQLNGVRVSAQARARFRTAIPAILFVSTFAALWMSQFGCSDQFKRKWSFRSAEKNYEAALEADHADKRREAVARIAESGYVDSEKAFDVLDQVARTEPVLQIRCIAVRAFARYEDDRPIGTLLKIMQTDNGSEQSQLPSEDLRWEVARTLMILARKDVLGEQQQKLACDLFIKLLRNDDSRNVRLIAAEALQEFHKNRVLQPLVNKLHSRDFALADQARRSLIALTGVNHGYDTEAWEKWIAKAEDPFKAAGRYTHAPGESGPGWLQQQKRFWRKALKMGEPET